MAEPIFRQNSDSSDHKSYAERALGFKPNGFYDQMSQQACKFNPDEPYNAHTPKDLSYLGLLAAQDPKGGLAKGISCAKESVAKAVSKLTPDQFAEVATEVVKRDGKVNKDGCLEFHELFRDSEKPAQPHNPSGEPAEPHKGRPASPPKYREAQFAPDAQPPSFGPGATPPKQLEFSGPPLKFIACPKDF